MLSKSKVSLLQTLQRRYPPVCTPDCHPSPGASCEPHFQDNQINGQSGDPRSLFPWPFASAQPGSSLSHISQFPVQARSIPKSVPKTIYRSWSVSESFSSRSPTSSNRKYGRGGSTLGVPPSQTHPLPLLLTFPP